MRGPKLPARLLRRVAIAGSVCALGALMLGSAAAAPAAEDGLNVAGFFNTPAANASLEARVDQLHPAWVRVFVNWSTLEPTQGGYQAGQLADYRAFFASLPAGTKVDVDVVLTPSWASGSTNPAVPPTNPQTYGAVVNYLANAFGSSVTDWEIWNEEDDAGWWTGTPAQYVGLLQAAYPSIKAVNPNATVLLGGLAANDFTYLQSIYADGGRNYFDGVAVHTDDGCGGNASPYSFILNAGAQTISGASFLGFTTVHSLMVANGDGAKPVVMTELGWSTAGKDSGCTGANGKKLPGVSESNQATYLKEAYHCLAQPQYSYVTAAIWFDMVDFGTASNLEDHYGLLSTTLQPKPSYKAFEKESSDGDQLTGACGNFSGPQVTLLDPGQGKTYSGPLLLAVKAIGHGRPVRQIQLKHDGKTILNFNTHDAHAAGNTLSGEINWQGAKSLSLGTHTISATATYVGGLSTTVTVTVVHVAAKKHHH
jgi:hypothetical protein